MIVLQPEPPAVTHNDVGGIEFTDLVDEEIFENLNYFIGLIHIDRLVLLVFELVLL